MKNRTMQAKHMKARKYAMKDFITNDNHRLAGGSWKVGYYEWLCNHKPYDIKTVGR